MSTTAEEHTAGRHTPRHLLSFPTRRSSALQVIEPLKARAATLVPAMAKHSKALRAVVAAPGDVDHSGRAHGWTPHTPTSALFPYTALFRSPGDRAAEGACRHARSCHGEALQGVARGRRCARVCRPQRKSTRLDATHPDICSLSLHGALPLSR